MAEVLTVPTQTGLKSFQEALYTYKNEPENKLGLADDESHVQNPSILYTLKLFLDPSKEYSIEGFSRLVSKVPASADKFIVALGLDFTDESPLSQDQLSLIRDALSTAPSGSRLGVADCSAPRLAQLIEFLGEDLKLSIDHIHAQQCCALPPEILNFARTHQIQLLAHHDQRSMLLPEQQKTLQQKTGRAALGVRAVLRTSAVFVGRQVVAKTGYSVLLDP